MTFTLRELFNCLKAGTFVTVETARGKQRLGVGDLVKLLDTPKIRDYMNRRVVCIGYDDSVQPGIRVIIEGDE